MRHLHVLRLASIAIACAAVGCKLPVGDPVKTDPANGTGSVKNWAFTISPSHNNFTLEAGSTDTTIVTVTRTGGFTGAINLEFTFQNGPDAGITMTGENVTETGVITTSRIITKVAAGHAAVTDSVNVHAAPVSNEVQGQFFMFKFNITKKPGVFVTAPGTLSVGRGQSIGAHISISRTSFDAPVPMNLVGAPAGVTATFSPNPVTDTATQMTLTTDASVAEGTYSIGVRANDGTTFQATAPVTLTVIPPGTISISLTSASLVLPKNSTVPTGVSITRTNYPGPVTFSLSALPAGVTASIAPNPVSTNSVQINFTNSGSGVAGSYPILVTASGVGLNSVSVTLTLNVN